MFECFKETVGNAVPKEGVLHCMFGQEANHWKRTGVHQRHGAAAAPSEGNMLDDRRCVADVTALTLLNRWPAATERLLVRQQASRKA